VSAADGRAGAGRTAMRDGFVIVGAGLAGASAAIQLRREGFEGDVLLVGEEPDPPYERPALSKDYLRGTAERTTLDVRDPSFYRDNRIELRASARVAAIDVRAGEVLLEAGQRLHYDRLLLATGAAPRRLDLPGHDLAGIHYLRTVEDADRIRAAAAEARQAVVIGGGWIGAEVAASLRQLGLPVALVMPGAVPLQRALGVEVGGVFRDLHAERGVDLHPNQHAAAFRGRRTVEAVEMADGTRIAGDLVVVGVGVRPRVELAAAAGLEVTTGILVDEHLAASAPGVFAAGDAAAAWHPVLGARLQVEHWDNARRQGRAAATAMLGGDVGYGRIPYFYSDQYDLGVEYTGYAPAWDRIVFRGDPEGRAFVAFWLADGRVVAGLNANVPPVSDAIAALVTSKARFAIEKLSDPDVPLDDLEALRDRSGPRTPAGVGSAGAAGSSAPRNEAQAEE
jgi:3-phenylpropionate/trans-cinnamate dioxygenase ferredoxin reductase component